MASDARGSGFGDECPHCSTAAEPLDLAKSTAGVELGFAKATDVPNIGVSYCASFTWTMMKHRRELECLVETGGDPQVVEDEYHHKFTAREFLRDELASVAMEFQFYGWDWS